MFSSEKLIKIPARFIFPPVAWLETGPFNRYVRKLFLYFLFCVICAFFGCEGKTRDQLFLEGEKQLRGGNPAGAIVLFKNALEKDPEFFAARFKIAKAYAELGRYEQAEREYLKLAAKKPSDPEIMHELVRVYIYTNRSGQAIKKAGECLDKNPGDSQALELLGISYAAGGETDKAECYLKKASVANPSRTSPKLELARLLSGKGRPAEGRVLVDEVIRREPANPRAFYLLAALELAAGNRTKAVMAYEKVLESNPNDRTALYRSGLLRLEGGDTAGAEKTAEILREKFPNSGDGFLLKGISLYYRKKYQAALVELLNANRAQPNIEGNYFIGLSHYALGEFESALSYFRKIIDLNPDSARARILAGMVLLRQKRTDDAIAELVRAVQVDGNNAIARNMLGSAYLAKGMFLEGITQLDKSIEIDPKLFDTYMKKGVLQLTEGKQNQAEENFKAAVRLAPDLLDTRLLLSSFYIQQNNPAKAVSTLEEGLRGSKNDAVLYNNMAGILFSEQKNGEAQILLRKAKATDPAFLAPYFNQAAFYLASGEREKALEEYRAILRRDPDNLEATFSIASLLDAWGRDREAYDLYRKALDSRKTSAFLALAGYHMKNRDPVKALSVLDKAIKQDPQNPMPLEVRGRVCLGEKRFEDALKAFDALEVLSPGRGLPLKVAAYVQMGDTPKAVEQARRIIGLKPDSAYGHMVLASVYESRNELDMAIEEVKAGISASGDSIGARMMLGNLYSKSNNFNAAMGAFDEIVRKNPRFPAAYVAQGVLLEKYGKKKEAVQKYRRAVASSPKYVPALNNLAYLYADGYGSPAEALRFARTAHEKEPGNPGVMDTLGYVLLKNGRTEEACRTLGKAAVLLPKNPTVLYHFALSCSRKGDKAKAVAELQRAMAMGIFPEKEQARALLANLNGTDLNRRGK